MNKGDFDPPFSFEGPLGDRRKCFDVYCKGEGPPVIILQELPGIGQSTLELAASLAEHGFRAYIPHLFGPFGRTSYAGNTARVMCMYREFSLFSSNRTSPIVDWAKALAQHARDETEASGVGVIGMCLTGNFAISLMIDDAVLAAVASQPSMPIGNHKALHMSPEDITAIRSKLDSNGPVLSYRFEEDSICSAAKFHAIDAAFNEDGTERVKLTTLPGPGHSVFTGHFVNEYGHPTRQALDDVITYFRQKLQP